MMGTCRTSESKGVNQRVKAQLLSREIFPPPGFLSSKSKPAPHPIDGQDCHLVIESGISVSWRPSPEEGAPLVLQKRSWERSGR